MNHLPRSFVVPRWITTGCSALCAGDLSPDLVGYLKSFRQPWVWFITAAVAAMLMGMTSGPTGFILAGALTGLTVAGCVWPWLAVRGIRCSLDFDRSRITEGELVQLRFRVENRWPIPIWGLKFFSGMELTTGTESPAADCSVALQMVGGWRTVEFTWDCHPGLRGVYPRTRPAVCTGFPFAFWFAKRSVGIDRELLVWPGEASLSDVEPPQGMRTAVQGAEGKHSGQETEVTGLRPYRHGDPLRQIHWPQTARQSELIVRERPGTCQPRFRIVVDLDPNVHSGLGPSASQETTLRAAGTLVRRLHRGQAQLEVQLGWGAAKIWENRQGLRPIMDAMARWSHDSDASDQRSVQPFSSPERILVVTTQRRAEQSSSFPRDAKLLIAGDSGESTDARIRLPQTRQASAPIEEQRSILPKSLTSPEFGYEPLAV